MGDATWSHRPRDSTGVELIAAGDVVGTRTALERGIAYGLAAASVETPVPPGVAVVLTTLAFNLLGDGLRDAFDPRSRL